MIIKKFSYELLYKDYLKNYLKAYAVSVLLLLAVLLRILIGDWQYKYEISVALFVGYPLLLFITSIYYYRKQRDLQYIFKDDSFKIKSNGKEKNYFLTEIIEISQPTKNDFEKTGIDFIKIKFRNKTKLMFSNTIPNFSELKLFLKKYLNGRLKENLLIK